MLLDDVIGLLVLVDIFYVLCPQPVGRRSDVSFEHYGAFFPSQSYGVPVKIWSRKSRLLNFYSTHFILPFNMIPRLEETCGESLMSA